MRNIKEIAEGNQTIEEGITEMQLMEKYFSLFNFTNYIFDPTIVRGLGVLYWAHL